MAMREIMVTRKRLGEMAKIAGDMSRQLAAMQLELEAWMNEIPDHVEQASESLAKAIRETEEFARRIAL